MVRKRKRRGWLQVLRLVDEVAVAQFVAWRDAAETAAEKARKKEMKGQKDALVSALHNRCKCAPARLLPLAHMLVQLNFQDMGC